MLIMNIKYFLIFLLIISIPHSSKAWSFSIHEKVGNSSIALIDGDFYLFLKENVKLIMEKSTEPDRIKSLDKNEGPRHYDDSDIIHQDINVSSSSEDYDLGVISWAIQNTTHNLANAIYLNNANDIIHYAGYLAHYASDSTQPLHATSDYDGQSVGGSGIHKRFETIMTDKYFAESFSNTTFHDAKVVDPYNETKKIIASGLLLVNEINNAHVEAMKNLSTQEEYYAKLWNGTSHIVIARINLAIQHTANLWNTAYQIAFSKGLAVFAPVFTTTSTSTESPLNIVFLVVLPLILIINKKYIID